MNRFPRGKNRQRFVQFPGSRPCPMSRALPDSSSNHGRLIRLTATLAPRSPGDLAATGGGPVAVSRDGRSMRSSGDRPA